MAICSIFGERDCNDSVRPLLKSILTELIEKENVNYFLVGNGGSFDRLARNVLDELCQGKYRDINYNIALAYPLNWKIRNSVVINTVDCTRDAAIRKRDEYLLDKADVVVFYVSRGYGYAAELLAKAEKKNIRIIKL